MASPSKVGKSRFFTPPHDKKALVSVVTPVYNWRVYVSRLLDSVLAQTYPNIEMILADYGSTDGTIGAASAYIQKFEVKGYSLQIVRISHKNASAAINAGLCHVANTWYGPTPMTSCTRIPSASA